MLSIVSPVLVFSGIYSAIGAFFLFVFYHLPCMRSSHMKWLIATCFMAAAYNRTWVGIYTSTPFDHLRFWIWALHVLIPIFAITITGYLSDYVKDRHRWIVNCFYIVFFMFFLAAVFGGKHVFTVYEAIDGSIGISNASIPRFKVDAGVIAIVLWAFLLFSLLYMIFHVVVCGLKGEKKEVMAITGAVSILFAMVVFDIAMYYKLISFIFISQYGFFFIMVAMCYGITNQISSQWSPQSNQTKVVNPDDFFRNVDTKALKAELLRLMHEEKLFTDENLSLDVTARHLSMSPAKLSRFMNVVMESDFRNFINRFRIEEAKRMLETDTDLSIKHVCYEVGFKSASTFHDSFKKFTGTSPGKFRKQFSE